MDAKGFRSVFFELNGVPREVRVLDKKANPKGNAGKARKADKGNVRRFSHGCVFNCAHVRQDTHVASSMPGTLVKLSVKEGQSVQKGAPLAMLSAMKMETQINAPKAGVVKIVYASVGDLIAAGDLLMEIH